MNHWGSDTTNCTLSLAADEIMKITVSGAVLRSKGGHLTRIDKVAATPWQPNGAGTSASLEGCLAQGDIARLGRLGQRKKIKAVRDMSLRTGIREPGT